MVRSLLIGLDGSPYSHTAIELGLRWARQTGAVLVGLGVLDQPDICRAEPVPLGATAFKERRDEALLAEARRKVEDFLQEFAGRCAAEGVRCQVLEDVGLPEEQIILESQRYDLILLGQRTYFHYDAGDDSDHTLRQVLHASPRPVITVPARLPPGEAVVIAYDGSLQAARTLQVFQAVGWLGAAEVHVVSVHADLTGARQRLARASEFLAFHGIAAQAHPVISSGAPAEVILDQVRRLNAGLLVMGAYGHSAIREFFFGSVTRTVLEGAPVPVFLYH